MQYQPQTLMSVEPERRFELLTYALRVRSLWKLVESGGDTSATAKGFEHFSGTRWSHTEASGLTTELTTLSDIQIRTRTQNSLTTNRNMLSRTSEVIAVAVAPSVFSLLTKLAP